VERGDILETLLAATAELQTPTGSDRKVHAQPGAGPFAAVLGGLMRNRGFGPKELPFMGLSFSTIYGGMLTYDRRDDRPSLTPAGACESRSVEYANLVAQRLAR